MEKEEYIHWRQMFKLVDEMFVDDMFGRHGCDRHVSEPLLLVEGSVSQDS